MSYSVGIFLLLIIIIIWLDYVCKSSLPGYWLGSDEKMYFIDAHNMVNYNGKKEKISIVIFIISRDGKKGILNGRSINWSDGTSWTKQGV